MTTRLLDTLLFAPAHTLTPQLMRALADHVADQPSKRAHLAARLDLPEDLAITLRTSAGSAVSAAWAARPDLAIAPIHGTATARDTLGGERRASVLAKLLTPTSDGPTRAAIADVFAAKPTKVLASAWLRLPSHLVPIEIVPAVLTAAIPTDSVTGDNPEHALAASWVPTVAYGQVPHLLTTHAPHSFAAPGPDPSGGASLLTYVERNVRAIEREVSLDRNSVMYMPTRGVYDTLLAITYYAKAGRDVPTGAVDAVRRLAALPCAQPTARKHGLNTFLHTLVRFWLEHTAPTLGTPNQIQVHPQLQSIADLDPTPATFTTLSALRAAPEATLDTHALSDLLRCATDSARPAVLTALTAWATTPATTPPAARARAEVGYALLANPTLTDDARDQLVTHLPATLGTPEVPAVLTNPQGANLAPLLTDLAGTDPDATAALYVAGAVQHTGVVPLSVLDPDRHGPLLAALADADADEAKSTLPGVVPPNYSAAIARAVTDPHLNPHALRHLPWTQADLLLKHLDRPDSGYLPADTAHARAAGTVLSQYLATAVLAIAGTSTALWAFAHEFLALGQGAHEHTTVGQVLDALDAASVTAA